MWDGRSEDYTIERGRETNSDQEIWSESGDSYWHMCNNKILPTY